MRLLREAGLEAEESTDVGGADVVVDALFGTGFSGAPRPEAADLIRRINERGRIRRRGRHPLRASTPRRARSRAGGRGGAHRHDARPEGRPCRGGRAASAPARSVSPTSASSTRRPSHGLVGPELLACVPRKRRRRQQVHGRLGAGRRRKPRHDGRRGLAARAAFRADAGYVAVAAPAESLPVLETLVLGGGQAAAGRRRRGGAARARALAVGPGLGRGPRRGSSSGGCCTRSTCPPSWTRTGSTGSSPSSGDAETVLTPHSGELARLLGEESAWVDAHRLEAVARAVERFGCVVLLKGPDTLVGAPGSGRAGRRRSTSRAGDRGDGRRAHRHRRRLPRQGTGRAHGGGSRGGGPAPRRTSRGRPAGLVASDVVEALPAALAD